MYHCSNCKTDLAPERMVLVDRGPQPGQLLVRYVCECKPGKELTGLYVFSGGILNKLLGKVQVPWEAKHHPEVVADDDPRLVAFRWELDQFKDLDEVVFWLENLPEWKKE